MKAALEGAIGRQVFAAFEKEGEVRKAYKVSQVFNRVRGLGTTYLRH